MVISQNETYSEKHFGMFAYNSGTVKQLGLEYPEIAISNASNLTGVAYLVGENNGTLEYSYVIDDEDVVDKFGEKHETAGIGAYGGTRIATLVASNNSTMQYNYAAVSIVFNYKVEDLLEYNNIVLDNSGTVSSCYFYDKSIQTTSISNDNSKITINYKSSYGIDSRTNPYYGVYCKDDTTLITNIKAAKEENEDTSGWYISSDYSNFASNIDIPYAIRRGVSVTENQHGEGEDTYYTLDVEINNEKDFAYMYELFNTDDKFASDAITYKINANINLDKLPVESYIYNKVIASKITGTELENVSTPKLANNKYAIYPTIYNGDIFNSNRIVKSTGVDCYGLFNYVSGEISNLNIIPNVLDFKSIDTTSSNVKGIGVVA